MPQELPKDLLVKVNELMKIADGLSYANKDAQATEKLEEAFALIPEPKNEWSDASIIARNIASYYFTKAMHKSKNEKQKQELLEKALMFYKVVMSFSQNIGVSYNHLRIGLIRYEMGDYEKAKDEFMRVYMAEGEEGFVDEDPKYFELIQPIV